MAVQKAANIVWQGGKVTRTDREKILGQKGAVIWLTGLSGSGKSTVAREVEKWLIDRGHLCYVLDGDNIRFGLNRNLGFSPEDRTENIRRIGEVCKLFADAGLITLAAFISPCRADRDGIRDLFHSGEFIEVFVKCPLEECEKRDVKGFYRKARVGEIREFTGISAPFEEPVSPELVLETDTESLMEVTGRIIGYLADRGFIKYEKRDFVNRKA